MDIGASARPNQYEALMSAVDQLREFAKDVRLESAKVSWPTREELRDSTAVVLATVVLVAAFLFVVDQILIVGVRLLFH
jgi:preprotein translocase subunit SecE